MFVEFVMISYFSVAPDVQCGTKTCQGGSVSECPHMGCKKDWRGKGYVLKLKNSKNSFRVRVVLLNS